MANTNALDLVESILQDARTATKEASLKKSATDPSEPTTNPVMKADDGTQPAREGSRSAENEADVRKALGEAGNTGQTDASKADGSKPTDTIGTVKQESDELKGNAKNPKTEKDLPPESKGHPSNVTGKYASLHAKGASLLQKFAAVGEKKEDKKPDMTPLKGKDASQPPVIKKAEDAPLTNAIEKEAQLKLAAAQKYEDDATAGYMAAEILVNALNNEKHASEKQAELKATITGIVKTAHADAYNIAQYLAGRKAGIKTATFQRQKFANDAMAEAGAEQGAPPGAGGELPPEAMAAMQGAGGQGPEAGGGPEGGVDPNVAELLHALEAQGITPEQLEAALAAEQGSGEGGEMLGAGGGQGAEGGAVPPPGPEKTGAARQRGVGLALAALRI